MNNVTLRQDTDNAQIVMRNLQMEQKLQQAQTKAIQLAFRLGGEIEKAMQMLQTKKILLESENESLSHYIKVQESLYKAELNKAVIANNAKIHLIIDKINSIVTTLQVNQTSKKTHIYSTVEISKFSNLLKKVSKFTFDDFQEYPNCYKPVSLSVHKEEIATYRWSDTEALIRLEPTMNSFIEEKQLQYKALASQIPSLNNQNLTLKNKRDKMISFHKEQMGKINRHEMKSRLSEISHDVNSTYKNVCWEKLAVADIKIWERGPLEEYTIELYHARSKKEVESDIQGIKERMHEILSKLEIFTEKCS